MLLQGSSLLRYSGTQELAPKGNGNVHETRFQVGIKVFPSLLVPLAVLLLADVKTDVLTNLQFSLAKNLHISGFGFLFNTLS
jgi:hypothetical protein